jgi:hypothetical protein
MTPSIGLAAWFAAALATSGAAPSPPNPTGPALVAPAGAAAGGLIVYRDPATGRPTSIAPEGVTPAQLSPALALDQPIAQRRAASGAWIADVPDYLQSYAVVVVGADGRPLWTCVDGAPATEVLPAGGVERDANGEETR